MFRARATSPRSRGRLLALRTLLQLIVLKLGGRRVQHQTTATTAPGNIRQRTAETQAGGAYRSPSSSPTSSRIDLVRCAASALQGDTLLSSLPPLLLACLPCPHCCPLYVSPMAGAQALRLLGLVVLAGEPGRSSGVLLRAMPAGLGQLAHATAGTLTLLCVRAPRSCHFACRRRRDGQRGRRSGRARRGASQSGRNRRDAAGRDRGEAHSLQG